MVTYSKDQDKLKVINREGFKKIVLNADRRTKKCYFIYLPLDFELPVDITEGMIRKFLATHKEILRPKYIRNWFYSKCLELGIPSGIIDFYQGRSPVTVGDKHYLDKERMADKLYSQSLLIALHLILK